jgi:hypothetical protein
MEIDSNQDSVIEFSEVEPLLERLFIFRADNSELVENILSKLCPIKVSYSQILDVLMSELINITTEEYSQEQQQMVNVERDVNIIQYFNIIDQ